MLKLSQLQTIVKNKIRENFKSYFEIELRNPDTNVEDRWYTRTISYVLPKTIKKIFEPILKKSLDLRRLDAWADMLLYFVSLNNQGTTKERSRAFQMATYQENCENRENLKLLLEELQITVKSRRASASTDCGYTDRFLIQGTDLEIGYGSIKAQIGQSSEAFATKYNETHGTFAVFCNKVEHKFDDEGMLNSVDDIVEIQTKHSLKLSLTELRNLLGLIKNRKTEKVSA